MRVPIFILLIYIAALATFPCCLVDQCANEKMAQDTSHKTGDDGCGTCSPFFNCEGCATATITVEPANLVFISIKATRIYSPLTFTPLPDISYDFWQPPKVG